MSLSQKTCVPCRGGMPPMTAVEIQTHMPEVPGWILHDGKLLRQFTFKNFKEAIGFINTVAEVAESEGHHPDIELFGWNKVKLLWYTHKIGGLHENDFIMAAKVNQRADTHQ